MANIPIPDSLLAEIRAQRAALVVGSNIGALAQLPSWKHILERFRDDLASRGRDGDEAAAADVSSLLKKGRLLTASRFLARALGGPACDAIITEMWRTPEPIPEAVSVLGRLPFRSVWTVHPGDLVERAILAGSPELWPVPQVASYEHTTSLDKRRRHVLKLLGDISQPESYVVLPKNVRRATAGQKEYRALLSDLYTRGTLLFVGFRHGDPDLHAILDKVFGTCEPPEKTHYFVSPGLSPVDIDDLSEEHELTVVPLEGEGGDAESLLAYLTALAAACENAEISLALTRPADDDLEGWLALLGENPADTDALAAVAQLEATARADKNAERLIEILLARVEHADSAAERAACLREVAAIYEQQVGDLPHAFTALTAGLREHPTDQDLLADAERLAAETDGWGELVQHLSEIIPTLDDKAIAANYWTRVGGFYRDKLRHDDYAVTSYLEAQKLDAEHAGAHAGLAVIYRKQQKWGDLAAAIEAQAHVEADVDKKIDLYLELGDLHETQLASTARAIESYEKALAADASNQDALAALERLYRRDELWGRLAHVIEKRADLIEDSDPARATQLRKDLAQLRSEKLGDIEGAISRYEAAVTANAGDTEALRQLERLYDKAGRLDDYFSVLERLADVSGDTERASLWRRLAAEVEDREGGVARAIAYYEKVADIEPASADVYRALERLYRKRGDLDALVELFERHIGQVSAPAERIELYAALGGLHEQERQDVERAIEAYVNVLDVDGKHRESLLALARLYKKSESWERAVTTLVRLAEIEGENAVPLWFEAGEILAKRLGESTSAEERLMKALELDPHHLPSLRALVDLYKEREDWGKAQKTMLEAEHHTQNRLEKIELLFEAARIREERLDQPEAAAEVYAQVLSIDPEHVEAGGRVAKAWIDSGRYSEVVGVLEMLVRKVDDRLEKARYSAWLAQVASKLGDAKKAAKNYRLAYESDREALDPALGYGETLFVEKSWDDLDKTYREILARHRTALSEEQLVTIWYRLGVAAQAREHKRNAEDAFFRVLEIAPAHKDALDAYVAMAAERGDWRRVMEVKQKFAETAEADVDQRVRCLIEVGDIYVDRLKDVGKALGTYLDALQISPDSPTVLHKMLNIYSERKQWREAVDTLAKVADLEKDATKRAKYHYATAVVCRDEIKDNEEALRHFALAMEQDVGAVPKAFKATERILRDKGDWKGVQRAYRKMLKLIGERASEGELIELWTGLADVNEHKLNDQESALAAHEVLVALEPNNVERHEKLASLYLKSGAEYAEKAAAELQYLIKLFPARVDLYKSLSLLYTETAQTDKAYCVAAALVFLGKADEEEKRRFSAYRPKQFVAASRRLTEDLWQKCIFHPREDRALNGIFGSLMASLAATTAQPHSALNLNPKDQADPERDRHLCARVFRYAVHTLGIDPQPELYLNPESRDGIRAANIAERGALTPAVLIGAPHVDKESQGELAFDVGKKLSFFRPERYVYYALPTLPRLSAALRAALKATGQANGMRVTGDIERLAAHLRKTVPGQVLEHVAILADKLESRESDAAVKAWVTATDLTADRAGFVLANDFETAARVIATEQNVATSMSTKERLRELLVFSVSEEYFTVRRHLGLQVTS